MKRFDEIIKTEQIKPNEDGMIVMDIPDPCPNCGGKMYSIFDPNNSFFHIKQRTWRFCKSCSFRESAENFKMRLCSV